MTQIVDTIYTANMTSEQRNWFLAEYQQARKDESIGVLLALFLGTFGIHHFYLRRDNLGILYLLLSWTGIPTILGFVECFFMPARVRRFNTAQAAYISAQIHAAQPLATEAQLMQPYPIAATPRCSSCSAPVEPDAGFCIHCGAPLHANTATQSST